MVTENIFMLPYVTVCIALITKSVQHAVSKGKAGEFGERAKIRQPFIRFC